LITRDIYDHGLHHRHLKFTDHWNTPRKIDVDFSYPSSGSSPPAPQPSLF
jgi:hypothetical protein